MGKGGVITKGQRQESRRGESSPVVANVELFCSVQEKVGLSAVGETRRNLSDAGL